jgi:rhamnogalacturonyl hydrolase YesR
MNPTSFNYIVAEWCGITGIFLQSMLNAYEHTIEDEVVKEVESTTNNTTVAVNQTQLDKENE